MVLLFLGNRRVGLSGEWWEVEWCQWWFPVLFAEERSFELVVAELVETLQEVHRSTSHTTAYRIVKSSYVTESTYKILLTNIQNALYRITQKDMSHKFYVIYRE